MRRGIRILGILSLVVVGLLGTSSIALADPPDVVGPPEPGEEGTAFLCPAVGKGVLNHRPDVGALPNDNYTFLPGHNQAGAHANENGHNALGPGDSPGPGKGNSDWSPIWPAPPTP